MRTVRLELHPQESGNTALLILGNLKLRVSNKLEFSMTKTCFLFELPPEIDSIKIAEWMERVPSDLRPAIKSIDIFEEAA